MAKCLRPLIVISADRGLDLGHLLAAEYALVTAEPMAVALLSIIMLAKFKAMLRCASGVPLLRLMLTLQSPSAPAALEQICPKAGTQ